MNESREGLQWKTRWEMELRSSVVCCDYSPVQREPGVESSLKNEPELYVMEDFNWSEFFLS